MKLRWLTPNQFLKKSTSAAVKNSVHLQTHQPHRRSHNPHHLGMFRKLFKSYHQRLAICSSYLYVSINYEACSWAEPKYA